jgi:hypothetical protein
MEYIVLEYLPSSNGKRATETLTVVKSNEKVLEKQLERGLILDFTPREEGRNYTICDQKIVS